MPSNYERGRAKEYRAIKILKGQGALWVRRSYGSKGIFDCWALFPDKFVAIQVKSNYCSPKEYTTLLNIAKQIRAKNLKVELWKFKKPRQKPEITVLNP